MPLIQVVCGPMFAGKSSHLIQLAKNYSAQGLQVIAIKPSIDNRYDNVDIVSHDGQRISDIGDVPIGVASTTIPNISDIKFVGQFKKDTFDVIIVDEAQFFKQGGIGALRILGLGAQVVVYAGLDLDAFGKPFGCMGQLLCEADQVAKLQGTCAVCSKPSSRTYRKNITENKDTVVVGGAELYEPRCKECWEI